MTDTARPAADPDALKLFSFQLFTKLEGAVTAGMIRPGDQLGLYGALAQAEGPLTTAELADRTGLAERWVREWAYNQGAAKMISVVADESGERFTLTPEAAAVLATPDHPAYGMGMFHRLPQTMRALEEMPASFRSGVGHDYDSHGPQGAVGVDGQARVQAGARVADIGCGAGGAVLLMARAFPNSQFAGYDISKFALGRAEQKLEESGLVNAAFHDPRDEAIPSNGSLDLVTTFDCIHDMTHPQEMMQTIRRALSDDGTWLLVDIKALDTFEMNAKKNPMAALMYGISVLSCMSSALSEPGGAGLGTLGLSENKAREMAAAAGFTRFRKLDVDHSVNAFYEVRP